MWVRSKSILLTIKNRSLRSTTTTISSYPSPRSPTSLATSKATTSANTRNGSTPTTDLARILPKAKPSGTASSFPREESSISSTPKRRQMTLPPSKNYGTILSASGTTVGATRYSSGQGPASKTRTPSWPPSHPRSHATNISCPLSKPTSRPCRAPFASSKRKISSMHSTRSRTSPWDICTCMFFQRTAN